MVQVIIRSIHVVSFISMFSIDYIFVSVMVYFFVNNIILYYSFGTCVSCTRTTPPFMSLIRTSSFGSSYLCFNLSKMML